MATINMLMVLVSFLDLTSASTSTTASVIPTTTAISTATTTTKCPTFSSSKCPSNWYSVTGNKCLWVTNEEMNGTSAWNYCSNLKGHLPDVFEDASSLPCIADKLTGSNIIHFWMKRCRDWLICAFNITNNSKILKYPKISSVVCLIHEDGWIELCPNGENLVTIQGHIGESVNISFCVRSQLELYPYIYIRESDYFFYPQNSSILRGSIMTTKETYQDYNEYHILMQRNPIVQDDFAHEFFINFRNVYHETLDVIYKIEQKDITTTARNTATTTTNALSKCPSNWYSMSENKSLWVTHEEMNYITAQTYCQNLTGRLLNVQEAVSNIAFIKDKLTGRTNIKIWLEGCTWFSHCAFDVTTKEEFWRYSGRYFVVCLIHENSSVMLCHNETSRKDIRAAVNQNTSVSVCLRTFGKPNSVDISIQGKYITCDLENCQVNFHKISNMYHTMVIQLTNVQESDFGEWVFQVGNELGSVNVIINVQAEEFMFSTTKDSHTVEATTTEINTEGASDNISLRIGLGVGLGSGLSIFGLAIALVFLYAIRRWSKETFQTSNNGRPPTITPRDPASIHDYLSVLEPDYKDHDSGHYDVIPDNVSYIVPDHYEVIYNISPDEVSSTCPDEVRSESEESTQL